MTGPYKTIEDIKAANEAAGQFWFSPDTMRFFNCRVLTGVYGGRFFVSSEKRTGFMCADGPRLYSVRRANDDGSIDTVGKFQGYETRSQAIAAAKRAAREAVPALQQIAEAG